MSFTHLLKRSNGYYYFRIRVPSDLAEKIPAREIVKSLKTTDRTTAKTLLRTWQHRTNKAFMLLRSDFLSLEQEAEVVSKLLPQKMTQEKRVNMRLSEAMAAYAKEHCRNWRPKSKLEFEGSGRIIVNVLGDREIKRITRCVVKDFRDKLLRLPANMHKKAQFRGKSIGAILAMNGIQPMAVTSVNKHLAWLSTVLKFCVREGYIPSNCAEGLQVRQDRRADEERKAYEKEDLQRMVSALKWNPDHPERFWIPLIALFSGMRINEICQLHTDDVREMNGIQCFDVNDIKPDKKLKNKSSRRVIPIHPSLIDMGLIDYIEALRQNGTPRLWMALKWREADGYYNAFGKWAQRFNKEFVTADPGKVLYSVRHAFANTLKQQGVQESIIAELMGHTNTSITTGRYGKRYEVERLFEALMRLNYGINLKMAVKWREVV